MNNKYIYPAVFNPCEEGGFLVTFPDLPGCITEGDTVEQAFCMAKEALELFIYNLEDQKEIVPNSSELGTIELLEKGSFISLIEACIPDVSNRIKNNAI